MRKKVIKLLAWLLDKVRNDDLNNGFEMENQPCYNKEGKFIGWFSRSMAVAGFVYCKDRRGRMHAGDTVYLTGTIYTSRDAGHKRMCEALARGEKIPFDPTNATIYYVGPTPAKPGAVIGSAGPTTSGRMDA